MNLYGVDRVFWWKTKTNQYFGVLLTLFVVFSSIAAQNTQTTENKADQTLKSTVRVNPVTRAMELSIPIANYPGRAGNSKPFVLNYSSKIWNMKLINTRSQTTQVSMQGYDYLVYQSTEVGAMFSEKSTSGWTSSLQPAVIYDEPVIYNEFGELYIDQIPSGLLKNPFNIVDDGCYWSEPQIFYDPRCDGLAWHSFQYCNCGSWGMCDPAPADSNFECAFGGPVFNPGDPGPWTPPNPTTNAPVPQVPHFVQRLTVVTPDGASHEFRKSDKVFNCQHEPEECYNSVAGIYLSVDSSGLRLVRGEVAGEEIRDVLYFPDGSRYLFTPYIQDGQSPSLRPPTFIDVNGNKSTYSFDGKWMDTMGREIQNPFNGSPLSFHRDVETQNLHVKGINNQEIPYSLTWANLDEVLEDPHAETLHYGPDACDSPTGNEVTGAHLFENQSPLPLQDEIINRTRYIRSIRMCAAPFGNGQIADFNPTVISEVVLPNGKKYEFKYNVYGEISKITYPTGSYERFEYGYVEPIGFTAMEVYKQSNRGVAKRYVSFDGTPQNEQIWNYTENVTTAPDGSSTERFFYQSVDSGFGFDDPRSGIIKEERIKDANGVLRSRTIYDWVTAEPQDGGLGRRDPRLKRSVTITFEPSSNAALATLNETDYDENVGVDSTYFSHLNTKRQKNYHYTVISNKTSVDEEVLDWDAIESWFAGKIASIKETDYSYGQQYHDRGIIGLPLETRELDPSNTSDVLTKIQFFYDDPFYLISPDVTPTGWQDPQSGLRGNVTFTRKLLKDPVTHTETWVSRRFEYDKFGNLRKVWDTSSAFPHFTETIYEDSTEKPYKFAYPTKVITSAPDPDNSGHGTDQTSSVETTYDFTTGLSIYVKDDYGQITQTDYNDPLQRPTKHYGTNFIAPITEMIYDDINQTVKIRKQIDELNWAESTTFRDKVGRIIKTQTTDNQGDVLVETQYDSMGRIKKVSSPHRSNETPSWTENFYDSAGRLFKVKSPDNTEKFSEFNFSTTEEIGLATTTTDAAARKSRSIINALGQLIRVDESNNNNQLGTIDNPSQPTYYKYNLQGKMVRIQQGIQNRYFLYDNFGRLLRVKQPEQEVNINLNTTGNAENNQWSAGFEYDTGGNLVKTVDAKNTSITNTYDSAGRTIKKVYSDGTPQVECFYDGKGLSQPINFAKGKLTKISNSISENRYTQFDSFSRLLSSEQVTDGQVYASSYKYNLTGELVEEKYPSGEIVRNFFGSDGALSRIVVNDRTYTSDLNFNASGDVLSLRLGNGLYETTQYNASQQLLQVGLGLGINDTSIWRVNYEYGALTVNSGVDGSQNTGDIAKQTITLPNTSFVQTYKYDHLDRLTEAAETTNGQQNWIQTFGHDKYGNRIGFSQNIGGQQLTINNQTLPAIDPNSNRFVSGQGYIYDANGNLTSDAEGRNFTFNGENKQTLVTNNVNAVQGRYFYDAGGKRVKKVSFEGTADEETVVFVYDGLGKLIAEYSNKLPSNPTINYTTSDVVGSPRIITDKNGNLISRRDFMPFGEELTAGTPNRTVEQKYGYGDQIRKKFTGYARDEETGLDFAEARYYLNKHGRFTAVDPLLMSGKPDIPQTFNRYVYVGNNPLKRIDPSGLIWLTDNNGHFVWMPDDYYNWQMKHNPKFQYKSWANGNGVEYVLGSTNMKEYQGLIGSVVRNDPEGKRLMIYVRGVADPPVENNGGVTFLEGNSLTAEERNQIETSLNSTNDNPMCTQSFIGNGLRNPVRLKLFVGTKDQLDGTKNDPSAAAQLGLTQTGADTVRNGFNYSPDAITASNNYFYRGEADPNTGQVEPQTVDGHPRVFVSRKGLFPYLRDYADFRWEGSLNYKVNHEKVHGAGASRTPGGWMYTPFGDDLTAHPAYGSIRSACGW
ncbi:MAG TPA: RHS repeat-associated core domain-containing protein [Pyrinomonadaceae bacterium]|jgi:RHS repeat-associated protein|nr:RHS repeat-associated core domain-containing protein [Pyrinomonadaceae bacterium]